MGKKRREKKEKLRNERKNLQDFFLKKCDHFCVNKATSAGGTEGGPKF